MVERAVYRPYGEQTEALASPVTPETKGWIGERYDTDAGLQYLNARYYDPILGLFLQPDWFEVMQAGVGTNRYGYAFGDPVNGRDPGGNSTYVEPDEETDREDDYKVVDVTEDDDRSIYVRDESVDKKDWRVLGETRFWDAFISPDTGNVVGTVYENLSFDERFATLGGVAENMDSASLALSSLPGQQMDVKSTTTGYTSYSGVLFDGKYMTLREIGNALAGYNAAGNGQSFRDFQRVAGALHVGGASAAFLAKTIGKEYGPEPNFGEIDYQRLRSEYGYSLDRKKVHAWLE